MYIHVLYMLMRDEKEGRKKVTLYVFITSYSVKYPTHTQREGGGGGGRGGGGGGRGGGGGGTHLARGRLGRAQELQFGPSKPNAIWWSTAPSLVPDVHPSITLSLAVPA